MITWQELQDFKNNITIVNNGRTSLSREEKEYSYNDELLPEKYKNIFVAYCNNG